MSLSIEHLVFIDDLFSGLQQEDEQPLDRKFDIETSPGLNNILRNFERLLNYTHLNEGKLIIYKKCLELVPDYYTSRDIKYFSVVMEQYQDNELFENIAGLFLSALINKSPEDKFRIYQKNVCLDNLGFLNSGRNIIINGDCGANLGAKMRSGKIVLNGNALSWDVGNCMDGGKIIVSGNAEAGVGPMMNGGRIIIRGNAINVGSYMYGGDIYVNGDLQLSSTDNTSGGNVYHKGIQVVKCGRRLI